MSSAEHFFFGLFIGAVVLGLIMFVVGGYTAEKAVRQEAVNEGHAHFAQQLGKEGYQFEWLNHNTEEQK